MKINARRVLSSAAGLSVAAALLTTGAASAQVPTAEAATTQLTIRVVGCEACEVGLTSVLDTGAEMPDVWSKPSRRVKDGKVTFTVPTDRTAGLSIPISAPWEGSTGYVALASLRYAGAEVGDKVAFRTAREQRHASGCWAGTTAETATLRLKVRRVTVDGNLGPTPGVMAWAARTQPYLDPMERVWHGVMGTQDATFCEAP
ncbi:MAG: hypothetical protein H0X12_18050 [Nocardioides sp.]|nr:hypothetical protein [Nocardioides sp.]